MSTAVKREAVMEVAVRRLDADLIAQKVVVEKALLFADFRHGIEERVNASERFSAIQVLDIPFLSLLLVHKPSVLYCLYRNSKCRENNRKLSTGLPLNWHLI